MRSRASSALPAVLLAVPLLGACSSGEETPQGAGAASTVTVTAADTSCALDKGAVAAGAVTFGVVNTGSAVTEVYVYGAEGTAFTKVVGEVEDIGPGVKRTMSATLAVGTYEIACKPGQTGNGIRSRLTVGAGTVAAAPAPSGSTTASPSASTAYDGKIELSTDGATLTGTAGQARVGQRIQFSLTNKAQTPLVLEIKDGSGAVAAESNPVPAGATGVILVPLSSAGTWTLIAEAEGKPDVTTPLVVSP